MSTPAPPTFDPCAELAKAQAAMSAIVLGGGITVIDTPGLGRVEYGQPNLAALGRYIDWLASQCPTSPLYGRRRRGPISIEAWP